MRRARSIQFKKVILDIAMGLGKDVKSYRELDVPRSTFYTWKRAYREKGIEGLINRKPIAKSHPKKLHVEVVEKIIDLRKIYHMRPIRISWYLERYHGIKTSCSTVYRTLVSHNLGRLVRGSDRRAIHTHRYAKEVPGHQVQVDVKFISMNGFNGRKVRKFQYTAIDDATRIRALKIYNKHNQENAIKFMDYVTDKFPFRIHTIRTDRGHEFQAQFHWHVEDRRIRHVYIRLHSPELNGKVERSHRSDKEGFYQLLTHTDDVDLNKKLEEWERFYNYYRPHSAFKEKTPYEALKAILGNNQNCP